MLRKTTVALAITLVLGGSMLSSSASARSGGNGGSGFRGNYVAGAYKGGRTVGDGYGRHGRIAGLRGGFDRYRRGDVWGHWGAYYGPMVSVP